MSKPAPQHPDTVAFPKLGEPCLYCVLYYPKSQERKDAQIVLVDGISGKAGVAQEAVRKAFNLKDHYITLYPVAPGTPGKRLFAQLELFEFAA